ncbi:MAG: phosphoribosyltransferase [Promethearchaeota archaeon]
MFSVRPLFDNREDAGYKLAAELSKLNLKNILILAIPCGGVPVGISIAKELATEFNLMIVRKLQIPWNPEAGFGAITPDGTYLLNPNLAPHLNLSDIKIQEIKSRTLAEIERRRQRFCGNRSSPEIRDRPVILVDDGLASGYTMLVAAKSVKKAKPSQLIVASPVASISAANLLKSECDTLVALHVSSAVPFAVASFYKHWHDLSDEEVIHYLKSFKGNDEC